MTNYSFQMKIISDCWRHVALKDIDPDDIQCKHRDGTNVEVQRRIILERKHTGRSDIEITVIQNNNNQVVIDNETDSNKDLEDINPNEQIEQTVEYL